MGLVGQAAWAKTGSGAHASAMAAAAANEERRFMKLLLD
jgi:hypothetical protein